MTDNTNTDKTEQKPGSAKVTEIRWLLYALKVLDLLGFAASL